LHRLHLVLLLLWSQGGDVVQRKEMLVDLVVGCRPPLISQIMFLCLNNSSIMFDGRVRAVTQGRQMLCFVRLM
jgi:hypothetical protein